MKHIFPSLSRNYRAALQTHLQHGHRAGLESARELGSEALAHGIKAKDLALLNEETLTSALLESVSARQRARLIKQAAIFFAKAITPVVKPSQHSKDATAHLQAIVLSLSQRTQELAASNLELSKEITQRKLAEQALLQSQHHSTRLLAESDVYQEQLRRLSRQMISAQEEDRKRISRELHDVIAQTLTGINIRLAALKKAAALNPRQLASEIDSTQRLVEKSVNLVHRFALELRPAVLDDLGLIPALLSYLKTFIANTGVRTQLTAFAAVERMDITQRTILFRVAQEALSNVAKHSQASLVNVSIHEMPDCICMKIADNGRSFDVTHTFSAKRGRLGLLGMRERVEMVGGSFHIESAPGTGTTITAKLPHPKLPGKTKPL
jgi:signal transduction histidine kinase